MLWAYVGVQWINWVNNFSQIWTVNIHIKIWDTEKLEHKWKMCFFIVILGWFCWKYIWIVWSNFVDRYLVVFPQRFLVFTNHFGWFLVAREVILIAVINQSHAQFLLRVFNFHVNWLKDYFQFLGFWPAKTACKNVFMIVHFIKMMQEHFMKLITKGKNHVFYGYQYGRFKTFEYLIFYAQFTQASVFMFIFWFINNQFYWCLRSTKSRSFSYKHADFVCFIFTFFYSAQK